MGVISALMLIEANNVQQHEKKKCKYCHGKGVLFSPIHETPISDSVEPEIILYGTFRSKNIEIHFHWTLQPDILAC